MAQYSAQSSPDKHSSTSVSTPFHASNPAFSPTTSPSKFDNDAKIPFLSPSSSTDRPITANSMLSTSSDSSSSSGTGSDSSYASSNPTSQDSDFDSDLPDKLEHSSTTPLISNQADAYFSSHSHNGDSESLPRPVSPFRAPRPPLHQQSFRSLLYQPTAMRSYVLPLLDSTSHPPPDPPVILPTSQSSFRSQAPYIPFLSHAPSPENSWIEVETLQHEYKLRVRLPGFNQDGITLATKRRRILQVVANKWENGGGHFERRISFGYDADLAHVRADFDGLMLCIMVPRQIPPFTTARSPPAALGRT